MENIDPATTVALAGFHPNIGYHTESDAELTATLRTELYFILEELYREGYRTFICTLESGFDLVAADTVIDLRVAKGWDSVRLVAVLVLGATVEFEAKPLAVYNELLASADRLIKLKSWLCRPCVRRNKFFRRYCSRIVCMDAGNLDDTYRLVLDAKKRGIAVTNLIDLIPQEKTGPK